MPYFSSLTLSAMQSAIDKLKQDITINQSPDIIKQDVINYYQSQPYVERGYAYEAADVAGNTGFNGAVANQNVENYFIATSNFASYSKVTLQIAEDLALNDWQYISNNGGLIPDIIQDDKEHITVYGTLELPIDYWSGTAFAIEDSSWLGKYATPYENENATSQSSLFSSRAVSERPESLGISKSGSF